MLVDILEKLKFVLIYIIFIIFIFQLARNHYQANTEEEWNRNRLTHPQWRRV